MKAYEQNLAIARYLDTATTRWSYKHGKLRSGGHRSREAAEADLRSFLGLNTKEACAALATLSSYQAVGAPPYNRDLNLMHEAEKSIMDESSVVYFDYLNRSSCAWHASAEKRAEAFLKCLGLWVEDEPAQKP